MQKHKPRAPQIDVFITKELIADSKIRDSGHCMFASAILKAVPNAKKISVDLQTIRFSDPEKGMRYTYLTPRVAAGPIVKFDQGMDLQPFKMRLRGGHVTLSQMNRKVKRTASAKQIAHAAKMREALKEKLAKTQVASRGKFQTPERIGGRTPPLQLAKSEKVPFSRRREFGIRALEY